MLRQTSQKALPFIIDLLRPSKPTLPEYTRQTPEARARLYSLAGLATVVAVGAVYGRLYATLPPQYLLGLLTPLPVLALLVIWVLPDRDAAPAKAMGSFLLGFFAVSVAWPDYLALQLPGLPWISVRRVFLLPMCLLLLICLSTSSDFRNKMRETLAAEPLLWKILLGFAIAQFLSLAAAANLGQGVKNFVNFQIAWTAVFFAAVATFRDERLQESFLKLFLMAALFIALIAIMERYNQGILWRNHIPALLQVDMTETSGALKSSRRDGVIRIQSVYNNPLPFAEIIALITPVTLYFIFTCKRLWSRIALIGADLLFLYVLTLPQSRLGLVGFMISHALFVLVWAGRIWLRNKFSILGPTITLAYPVVLIALAAAVMSVGSLREKVIGGSDTIYSDQTRKLQRISARGIILRSPIIGYGPRQGVAVMPKIGFGVHTLDNYYLWIALDYGFLGFIAYYWMLLLAMHRSFMMAIKDDTRDNNIALVILSTLTSFLVIKGVLSEDDNHSLIFMMLGILMGIIWRQKKKEGETAYLPSHRKFAAG